MAVTMKLASGRSDLEREKEGDWVEIPDWPGVELQVRSLNYAPYQQAFQHLVRRWQRKYGDDGAPPDELSTAIGGLYARHILLGWRGFDVDYSAEAAEFALTDVAHRDLRNNVTYAANRVGRAEAEFVEEAGKNSRRSSGGGSTAAA